MSIRDALLRTKGLWLRQLSDCAEADFKAVAATFNDFLGSSTVLYQKVLDGTTWQGSIDSKTPIHSIADIQAVIATCVANGIGFVPVVVPRGLPGEAALHAQVASAASCLCVDLEAGTGFWDKAPIATILNYVATLRANALNSYLIVQPDPRNLSDILFTQHVRSWDAISGQHYVGWTDVGWNDTALEVQRFDIIKAFGKDLIPILYGEGNWSIVEAFWRAIQADCIAVQVFRFGAMDEAQLTAYDTLEFTSAPDCQEQLDILQATIDNQKTRLQQINALSV